MVEHHRHDPIAQSIIQKCHGLYGITRPTLLQCDQGLGKGLSNLRHDLGTAQIVIGTVGRPHDDLLLLACTDLIHLLHDIGLAVDICPTNLGESLNPQIHGRMWRLRASVVFDIGICGQHIGPLLEMLDVFRSQHNGPVLRLVFPPDIGMDLVAIQIHVKTLAGQYAETIRFIIQVVDFKSRPHQQELSPAPVGGELNGAVANGAMLPEAFANRCSAAAPGAVIKIRQGPALQSSRQCHVAKTLLFGFRQQIRFLLRVK